MATNVVGILTDSGGTLLEGKLYITLDGNVSINTVPKTLLIPKTKIFNIINGNINIPLEETEVDQVTYRFQFFETVGAPATTAIIEPSLIDFQAIVPNETSVDFVDLLPTSIKNSQIDSGARRVAKLIIDNPFFVDGIKNLSKPAFFVESNANQTIGTSDTVIQFQLETLDSNGTFDNATTYKFTAPPGFGGTFLFGGLVTVSQTSGSNKDFTISLRKNSVTIKPLISQIITSGSTIDIPVPMTPMVLVAGDTIEMLVQTTGGFTFALPPTKKRFFGYRLAI